MSRWVLFISAGGRRGVGLLEVIIGIGIMAMVVSSIAAAYLSLLDALGSGTARAAAAALLQREMEIVRNLSYEKIGLVGGIPAGVIPSEKTVTAPDGRRFTVAAVVRNIDDPADGVVGGSPGDTAPADYKLVQFTLTCPDCRRFAPISLTMTAAPAGLESAGADGSLFINVFDANGIGLAGATVHVVNTSTTPTIDLTDVTDNRGQLQLVGAATSTESYRIEVSRSGYSSDRTYPPNSDQNPNPVKPDATVVERTITQVDFAIDRLSALTVAVRDHLCVPIANQNFSISGAKLIGADPDVFKFATSSATGAGGERLFDPLEWDDYTISYDGTADLRGTLPLLPLSLEPSSTALMTLIVATSSPKSLLVTVSDVNTTDGIADASVTVSDGSISKTKIVGRSVIVETDWSNGRYDSQDGGIAVDAPVGSLTLVQGSGGYSTTTTSWLISKTIDTGSSATQLYRLSWNPATQPSQTGANSLRFQIAATDDPASWTFLGPDGTADSYYAESGAAIAGASGGKRYLRYKAYLKTADAGYTPRVDDISIEFSGACVPHFQTLFTGLAQGDYTVEASANGYQTASSSVTVSAPWQETTLYLSP